MTLYSYRALSSTSAHIRGTIDAASLLEAKQKLHKRQLLIVEIKPYRGRWLRLSMRDRQFLMRELSRLLQAGLPLYEALLALEEKYRRHPAHPLLLDLSEQVRSGTPISKALASHPRLFSLLETGLISNAEKTGTLAEAFQELATLLQKQLRLQKQLLSALLYPLILSGFCLLVLGLLLFYVIPSLQDLFEGRALHPLTSAVLAMSRFAVRCKAIILGGILSLISLGFTMFFHPRGKEALQRVACRLPLLRPLLAKAALLRFCRASATLLEGGVPALIAFREAKAVMRHPELEEVVTRAEKEIGEGVMLHRPFDGHPLIPPLVPRLLALAQQAGNLSFMMRQIAEIYEDDLQQTVTQIAAMAQPILLLVLGAVVGLILLAVLIPLTDVGSFLN